MRLLVENIGTLAGILDSGKPCLRGKEMNTLHCLEDAWLLAEDGLIKAFGPMAAMPPGGIAADTVANANGGFVMPAWCDPHTHIVYAGSREGEFADKIRGLSYAEIARRGGGILNSADLLHTLSEDELYRQSMRRVREVMLKGTGCIEIKSGYGLNTANELKMLRVIRRISESVPARVVSTFLGAHAVGRGMEHDKYVCLVADEMIPEVGRERLADFVDVFCDEGFFTPADTDRILEAAAKWGMRPKIHVDELAATGGLPVAVRHGALSVDHLENMPESEIAVLKDSQTMPTALPGTSFFLNMPYAPARRMIDAGLPVALASDYNPGSTPSGDMKFVVSLACIKLRLTPAEALNAATVNAAFAMGLSNSHGTITTGKAANFFITDPVPSADFIPYAYTTPLINRVFLAGKEI